MGFEFKTASKGSANKVFLHIKNDGGEVLEPGKVTEFTNTTTDADQGFIVGLQDSTVNLTTSVMGQPAGVVHTTIQTSQVGKLQVWGPANVRASASIAADTLVVAYSINATNIGHVTEATTTTATGPAYNELIIGRTLEDGPNATNATVFLKLI